MTFVGNSHGGKMVSILAIDAAWTNDQPSGVALVTANDDGIWTCRNVAPSYDSFIRLAQGCPVNWMEPSFRGGIPDPKRLLNAASLLLAGDPIDLVTVDMPLATVPIDGRREADTQISRNFGGAGCATHSPNSERPGKVSETLRDGFLEMGFPLSTLDTPSDTRTCLVEVYPHPAILRLLNLKYRLPYKVSKSAKYWPKTDSEFRIVQLLRQFGLILAGLTNYIEDIPIKLPQPNECVSLSYLKRYEDAIDALVCAWVGICFLENNIVAFGDVTAAIWVPPRPDESLALPADSHFPTKIKVRRRRNPTLN